MSWRCYALAIVVVVIALLVYQNWIYVRAIYNQPQLFRAPVFDTQAPALPEDLGAVAILSFARVAFPCDVGMPPDFVQAPEHLPTKAKTSS